MNLQEKLDATVEEFQQNEQEINQLKQALEERKRLQDQLVGRVSVYKELLEEQDKKSPVVEGEAEEIDLKEDIENG